MISQSKQKGFTIVELLIVIVVIGILAAISIVAYNNVTQKARDDQRISDARNITSAAAAYNSEKGKWPTLTELTGYDTVKLTGTAASRLKDTGTVNATNKDDLYVYRLCGTAPNNTGAEVTYWKEAPVSPETNIIKLSTGTGC